MTIAASMWIRDGVLDRLHINLVAFAFAYYLSLSAQGQGEIEITQLINFALANSGLSCSQKMNLFNAEVMNLLLDVEKATALYNDFSGQVGKSAHYFSGAIATLRYLKESGAENFITSAVAQELLDCWLRTAQGLEIAPSLAEVLGRRLDFVKGLDHFKYVSSRVAGQTIYYVADAPLEIEQAIRFDRQCNLVVIGFANHIDSAKIKSAEDCLRTACGAASILIPPIALSRLQLPELNEIKSALQTSGADFVASDFGQLHSYFSHC